MRLAILGSTGSIGCNTLQVVREMGEGVEIAALTAGANVERLLEQALEFRPELLAVADDGVRRRLLSALAERSGSNGYRPEILCGPEGNLAAAVQTSYDTLVSAAVGVVGLPATFEAVKAGKRVALANKEVLVAAGELTIRAARESGAEILPVDSEHNAVHQCLRAGRRDEVDRVILTASGGPFRTLPKAAFSSVTPTQALNHPTWRMGDRITIDSATLMNKGFEVIEACWLFDMDPRQVQVAVHPQSIVHALVEFRDGSVIAQLGPPDMKLPIRYALNYPERQAGLSGRRLAWDCVRELTFEPPDFEKFPLLRLAYNAIETGGAAGCVLNAADEVAVDAFLKDGITFDAIPAIVESTLERVNLAACESIAVLLEIDREARRVATEAAAARRMRVG